MTADLRSLSDATHSARARTGDDAISTVARRGRLQVARVTHSGRTCVVEPLSDWLSVADAVAFLNALDADSRSRGLAG